MDQHEINLCLAIKTAVTETIENMVYMVIVTDLQGASDCIGIDGIMTTLRVLAPRPGLLSLAMPRSTAVEISKRLFQLSERELSEVLICDVTCELLNTISGRVMNRLLPSECAFQLGFPEIVDTPFDPNEPVVKCNFLADGILLSVAAQL
jgi:CheY-specific phosphatase CheX